MPLYKIFAINLKVTDFGEADKLVTVFSHEKGKIRVLAKGSRKAGSKLSGPTELFIYSRMLLATGRNFEILTDAQILESFKDLRKNLARVNLALYFVWLTEQMSAFNLPNTGVFELLLGSLYELIKTSDNESVRNNFEKELAALEGIKPRHQKTESLKKYFEVYLERIFPEYFNELEPVKK